MVLPENVKPYRQTAEFDEKTVPSALLGAHATKDGAWALIRVLEGKLLYRIEDPRRPLEERLLTPNDPPGVIEPTILHSVAPQGPVRFYVEFFRTPV